jgi:DNA polymerase III subunit delta'
MLFLRENNMVFPWQTQQWQQLLQSKEKNRLPHALLLTGMTSTGKAHFAHEFTRALLCYKTGEEGCDCHACRLIVGRTHPNVLWIEPEKAGHAIKIDQIREVAQFVNQSSLQGVHRIVLINPANAMNMHAANALLKTLEEPSSGAIIVLISHQYASLPATILSRCQRIIFPRPQKEVALAWLSAQLKERKMDTELLLNLAHGAPLAALALVEDKTLSLRQDLFQALYSLSQKQSDPVLVAASMREAELLPLLDLTLSWMRDLLCHQWDANVSTLINKDYMAELNELKQKTNPKRNADFMEYVQRLRGQLCLGMNFNKQLVIESTFIQWAKEC